ncbi:thiopurine S-methyltransferase-like [Haemaphysalis longicornis]
MDNVYGAVEKGSKDYWKSKWSRGQTSWQLDGITNLLQNNREVVLAGKVNAEVFIPLCGKANELKWFYDLGHRVVGVEFIEDCAREFFSDNGLEFKETICPVTNCPVFQNADGRLRIFTCSIFDFKRECAGAMDVVWDRASFSAINEEDRGRYSAVMKSLLAPACSYGLCVPVYDAPWYKGNPRSVDEAAVRDHYGDVATFVLVDSVFEEKPGFLRNRGSAMFCLWHLTV